MLPRQKRLLTRRPLSSKNRRIKIRALSQLRRGLLLLPCFGEQGLSLLLAVNADLDLLVCCIHLPLSGGGATVKAARETEQKLQFQPTPPARGATSDGSKAADASSISTHAPREGSDFAAKY